MAEQYRSLMARYQAGEGAAFEALYCQLAPELRKLLHASAPEASAPDEMVEQIFLELHRARSSYDPRHPFEPWLMAVVNHVVDGERRRPRRGMSASEFLGRLVAPRPSRPQFPSSLLNLNAGDFRTGPRG